MTVSLPRFWATAAKIQQHVLLQRLASTVHAFLFLLSLMASVPITNLLVVGATASPSAFTYQSISITSMPKTLDYISMHL